MKSKSIMILLLCILIAGCSSSQKKERNRTDTARYQYNLGSFHMNQGNVDQAIKHYKNSLEIEPGSYQTMNALGLAYAMQGNFQDALTQFNNCLKINPRFTEARNNMAMIYQEMGQIDLAEEEYKKAIDDRNYQSRENPYYNLARLYLAKDELDLALFHVNMALELNNRMVLAHNLQGIIYERLNRFEDAIISYKNGLKMIESGDDTNLKFNLAVAYFKNNQYDLAKEFFVKILAKTQDPELKKQIDDYLSLIKE
ncbi:MAG: tetratricopeptide repeat protein [Candidatus Aminicenantes bacterium]|nr:tetratricopeptide repeat protein [Candidatus Aminicenantes bacterium]